MFNLSQKTINNSISCNSVGLHSGENIKMTFKPAPENTGIVFKRIDITDKDNAILASYKNVITTNLSTTIANSSKVSVSTIEHVMAAIWGCGIDNMIIEIDNIETPIMDGSSAPFVFLIECAGICLQNKQKQIIQIIEEIHIEENDKFIHVSPSNEFMLDISIDFNNKLINNHLNYHSNSHSFKNNIARARTFCFKHEIDNMHKLGLAKGGSLDNAIVIDNDKILNNEGLRYEDEFIRHKTLDFIGDLFLAERYIIGAFKAHKVGHGLNNKFLHHLFENQSKWVTIPSS